MAWTSSAHMSPRDSVSAKRTGSGALAAAVTIASCSSTLRTDLPHSLSSNTPRYVRTLWWRGSTTVNVHRDESDASIIHRLVVLGVAL